MGGEKVVDDLDAVVGVDVAQSCEASEHYRSEELNEGEGGVDLAEHSAGVRGRQDLIQGPAVLLYDTGPEARPPRQDRDRAGWRRRC